MFGISSGMGTDVPSIRGHKAARQQSEVLGIIVTTVEHDSHFSERKTNHEIHIFSIQIVLSYT